MSLTLNFLPFSSQNRALHWTSNPSWAPRWQLNPQNWHVMWPILLICPMEADWVSPGSTPHFLVLSPQPLPKSIMWLPQTKNCYKSSNRLTICFSICSINCRYRGWSSELASHWLPGRQWQPVARIDVFWQAEERLVVSDQSPAQHIQTAIPPHKGSNRERAVNIIADGRRTLLTYLWWSH